MEQRRQAGDVGLAESLLQDSEASVRDEARTALEQLEDPDVIARLQALIEEGFLH